jgi:ABC-type enterobactin transport system permease subunit
MTTTLTTLLFFAIGIGIGAALVAGHKWAKYDAEADAERAALWRAYTLLHADHQRTRAELAAASSELAALAACSDMTAGQALEIAAALQCATRQAQAGPVVEIGAGPMERLCWN